MLRTRVSWPVNSLPIVGQTFLEGRGRDKKHKKFPPAAALGLETSNECKELTYQSLNMGTNIVRSNCRFLVLLATIQQPFWRTSLLGSEDEGSTVLPEMQEFRSPRDGDLQHSVGKTWVISRDSLGIQTFWGT